MEDLVYVPNSSDFLIRQFRRVINFGHENSGVGEFVIGPVKKAPDLICRRIFVDVPTVDSD